MQNILASLEIGPISVPLSDSMRQSVAAAGDESELVAGIRAEHVKVVSETDEGSQPATVFLVEHLGDENIVDLKLGDLRLKTKTPPSVNPREGDTLYIQLLAHRVHVFRADTGMVIQPAP